jgi:signal transduction histidine kinase
MVRGLRGGKARSIARRLFVSAIVWSVALLLVAGVIISDMYRRTTEQAFDQRLDVYLRAIVADVATPGDDQRLEPGQLGEPQFELTLSGWYWEVTRLDADKPAFRASRSLFASQLPRLSQLGVQAGLGGSRSGYAMGPEGRRIRIVEREIDIGDSGIYLVQVAATTEEVEAQIWRFYASLALTFGFLAVALAGAAAMQVRFGLRPLRALQEEVSFIRQGERDRIEGRFSDDLAPLAGELNLLISSNREILERARTQVGNLAHALKTPLSVLLNDARTGDSPLAEKVEEQARIMSDQVTWYLDRARAAARSNVIGAVTEVEPVIGALIRTFEKIYAGRGLVFSAEVEAGLKFRGERQDFEEMIGNLLDNAGKWAASQVTIRAFRLADSGDGRSGSQIVIDDDGPGLPPQMRAQALTRGRRLDETKPGSGLGLSIVNDLVAVHGGEVRLEDGPLGGLRVRLGLPGV